jgi:hypothetical protein
MDEIKNNVSGQEPEKIGAAKIRSETAYPFFGLGKVLEIVRAVQRAGGNEPAPAADVLTELNVQKTDRTWAYGIPAAGLFGVIERVGRGDDAKIKLTELGLRLALPGTPEEERASKAAAVKSPDLYTRLLERFANCPMPSKEVLKRLLQRDFGIVESMAGGAADAFLDSVKVAELITPQGVLSINGQVTTDGAPPLGNLDVSPPPHRENEEVTQIVRVPREFFVYKCKIGNGRVIDLPLPPHLTKSEAERIEKFLKTAIDDDAESADTMDKTSSEAKGASKC